MVPVLWLSQPAFEDTYNGCCSATALASTPSTYEVLVQAQVPPPSCVEKRVVTRLTRRLDSNEGIDSQHWPKQYPKPHGSRNACVRSLRQLSFDVGESCHDVTRSCKLTEQLSEHIRFLGYGRPVGQCYELRSGCYSEVSPAKLVNS